MSKSKKGLRFIRIWHQDWFCFEPDSFITIYAKFEALEDSKKAFDEIYVREIISWNAMISGSAQNGFSLEAVLISRSRKQSQMNTLSEVS